MENIQRSEAKDHQATRKQGLDAIGLCYITSLNMRLMRNVHLRIGKIFALEIGVLHRFYAALRGNRQPFFVADLLMQV